ncbi:MAG: WhiB family transcriptional regulator [Ferrimicrobium sp.]
MVSGQCRGVDLSVFFPTDGSGVIAAQQVCEECPVCSECLAFALQNRICHGVWGGTSERQRKRLLRMEMEGSGVIHKFLES